VNVVTANVEDPEIGAGGRAKRLFGGLHGQVVETEMLERRPARRSCGIG
jgi:hypothetical protein